MEQTAVDVAAREVDAAQPGPESGPGSGAAKSLRSVIDGIQAVGLSGWSEAELVEAVSLLEDLKGSASALQARCSVRFDRVHRHSQADAGVSSERLGRGIADQLALARRVSPGTGSRQLGIAQALLAEMPHTFALFAAGRVSEAVAGQMVTETAAVSAEHRGTVDERLAQPTVAVDPVTGEETEVAPRLVQLTPKGTWAAVRGMVCKLDPASVVRRRRIAESERHVSIRPLPDVMVQLTAVLPVAAGVACWAGLDRASKQLQGTGDPRSLGQLRADLLVEHLTGRAAGDLSVEVQIVIAADALIHPDPFAGPAPAPDDSDPDDSDRGDSDPGDSDPGDSDPGDSDLAGLCADCRPATDDQAGDESPSDQDSIQCGSAAAEHPVARLVGYGPIPASMARALIRDTEAAVWVRRLITDPVTGIAVDLDSRRRLFPRGHRRLIIARDQRCRMPFCDNLIREIDHIVSYVDNGRTDLDNGQGLCRRHNLSKAMPGWHAAPDPDPDPGSAAQRPPPPAWQHQVVTPTGHRYSSRAPTAVP